MSEAVKPKASKAKAKAIRGDECVVSVVAQASTLHASDHSHRGLRGN